MDSLVKRFKDFYTASPFYQYRWSKYGPTLILEKSELNHLLEQPINQTIVFSDVIKPLPQPVSLEELEIAEQKLSFVLPSLLRELYTEIANGGFGPGIMGLDGDGWRDGFGGGNTAVGAYLEERNMFYRYGGFEDWHKLLKGLLPIGYGGCHYIYLLDCRVKNGPILRWASNGLDEEIGWDTISASLRDYLNAWLAKPFSMHKGFIYPDNWYIDELNSLDDLNL